MKNSSIFLCQNRLGHLPLNKIKQFSLSKESYCSANHTVVDSFVCNICPQARKHRLSFPHSQIHTNSIFELIHIDTWGPYHTTTYDGYRNFLIVIDDFSRATWTFFVRM